MNNELRYHARLEVTRPLVFNCECLRCGWKWVKKFDSPSEICLYAPDTYIERIRNWVETIICPICSFERIQVIISECSCFTNHSQKKGE